jgi:hypothetical protein
VPAVVGHNASRSPIVIKAAAAKNMTIVAPIVIVSHAPALDDNIIMPSVHGIVTNAMPVRPPKNASHPAQLQAIAVIRRALMCRS